MSYNPNSKIKTITQSVSTNSYSLVPTNAINILFIYMRYVCDATVGTRVITANISDNVPNTIFEYGSSSSSFTAGVTYDCIWAPLGARPNIGNNSIINILPSPCLVLFGETFTISDLSAVSATDTFTIAIRYQDQ